MSPKTHHFHLDRAHRHAIVKHSDLVCVELPESPTSGYRWQLAPHVKLAGLKLIEQYVAASNQNHLQTRTFVFRSTGETKQSALNFSLNRPTDCQNSTLQHFNVDVELEDDNKLHA